MDFIDEEDAPFRNVRKDSRQVLGFFQGWSAGHADLGSHFICYDRGQCGLSQSWRPYKEYMVQRISARLGGLDKDRKVLLDPHLALEISQDLRTQYVFL